MKLLPATLLLVTICGGVAASVLYAIAIASTGGGGSGPYTSHEDRLALDILQTKFQQCVKANGMGLQAQPKDYCTVTMSFPSHTAPKWKNPKTGDMEGLAYDFDICQSLSLWELIRNTSTILTKEYIDALPNGWEDYAWKRINKGILLNNCKNKTHCLEKLSLVLPESPPFTPRQFGRCAVVGNSGDLLKTHFGDEIDQFDAVVRNNGAPTKGYAQFVGTKNTFRLLNRGSAKALDKVSELDDTGNEVLIIKTTIHDIMTKMIQEVPIKHQVYLMLGMPLGPAAKGTGLKALEFALSVCETVDIYGFTVDPGYTEWTRYFSESRGGHTPLQGRAYYQMMECLGLITIHSPMRDAHRNVSKDIPERIILDAARKASDRVCRNAGMGRDDPLAACAVWAHRTKNDAKKHSLKRKGAMLHDKAVKGVTFYPLEQRTSNELLCMKPIEMDTS